MLFLGLTLLIAFININKIAETTLSVNRNVKKAIRILTSPDSYANDDDFTLQHLVSKYPKPSRDLHYSQPTNDNSVTLIVKKEEVQNAIMSVPNSPPARINDD